MLWWCIAHAVNVHGSCEVVVVSHNLFIDVVKMRLVHMKFGLTFLETVEASRFDALLIVKVCLGKKIILIHFLFVVKSLKFGFTKKTMT